MKRLFKFLFGLLLSSIVMLLVAFILGALAGISYNAFFFIINHFSG